MFSAHLVFGDIDKHSRLSFPLRREQLEIFWAAGERLKLRAIDENPHSFFDVDNDCIMVGLSNVAGLTDGVDVLTWALSLQHQLLGAGIPVSFGVNLIACGDEIKWATYPGFRDRSDMLYMPDRIYEEHDRVQRSRLAGDGLIVVSRLLGLAKKLPVDIVFSTFQGGHLHKGVESLEADLAPAGPVSVREVTNQLGCLSPEKQGWLEERGVRAWGITRR